ncbi:hypothetical protein H0H93_007648 [Arthromyces matolae]|nr:hypothetical protein H0H93_007648 [Arthromyces matolae]
MAATRQSIIRFTNQTIGEEEIWILLTRHINDSSRTSEYISLKVDLEDDLPARSNLFDQTILATKGTYTNSTHVLVRTKIHSSVPSGIVSIFSSYDGKGMDVGYTLSAYSTSNVSLSWETALPSPPFTTKVDGVFTNKNAGGNCTYPTFMVNPQYHLQIHPRRGPNSSSKARVTLTLQTQRDTPINISLVYSQGGRIDELSENELIASSGAYTYGLARVRKEILPGDSTVILSAFEPRYTGPYTLKIDSSHPFELRPIPQEGAGMYGKVVRGAWTRATSGGGPTSDRYSRNPIFEINIPSLTQLKIRLQLLPPFTPTLLNVTIFPASDRSLQHHIATSGVFNDSISGVATPQISLAAGKSLGLLLSMTDVHPSYKYDPGVLGEDECFWRDHYDFLKAHGYTLRQRYKPDWVPSWEKDGYTGRKDFHCEDWWGLPHFRILDAERNDGSFVVLKKVDVNSDPYELLIAKYFSTPSLSVHPKNHCVPILDIINPQEGSQWAFLVMPYLLRTHEPPFTTIGEVIAFFRQIVEGIEFMHSHNVVHGDCKTDNFMADTVPLFNGIPHPKNKMMSRDFRGHVSVVTSRTKRPVCDPAKAPHLRQPPWGGYKSVPEFHDFSPDAPPCDPFAVDVYCLGHFIRLEYLDGWDGIVEAKQGFEFMRGLVDDMTQTDPKQRPSMADVARRFDEIVKGLDEKKLRSPVLKVGKKTKLRKDAQLYGNNIFMIRNSTSVRPKRRFLNRTDFAKRDWDDRGR